MTRLVFWVLVSMWISTFVLVIAGAIVALDVRRTVVDIWNTVSAIEAQMSKEPRL